jgi:AIPR protein
MASSSSNDQILIENLVEQRRAEIAPELKSTDFFEFFVVDELLRKYDLSIDELREGLVGGGNDGGIDGFYFFINGRLVAPGDTDVSYPKSVTLDLIIVQAKFAKGFSEIAVQKLESSTADLFDLSRSVSSLAELYNESLLLSVETFRIIYQRLVSRFPNLRVRYVYATKGGTPNLKVRRRSDKLVATVRALFPDAAVQIDFVGARGLLDLARQRRLEPRTLSVSEGPISTQEAGYVSLVNLHDYFKFITDDDEILLNSLFESNVRAYEGEIVLNQAIQSTLRDPASPEFWWLNNGITIVAGRISGAGKSLTLEDPQIVNGLQTSVEIFKYFAHTDAKSDPRDVLIRVIVPPDDVARDQIIRATNSQTNIPLAALRATDRIQRDIEDYFEQHGLYYERRRNQHRSLGRPAAKIISMPYLASSIMSVVLQKPSRASATSWKLLRRNDTYQRIFNRSFPLRTFLRAAQLVRRVETEMRARGGDYRGNVSQMFYVAAFIATASIGVGRVSPESIADFDPLSISSPSVIDAASTVRTIRRNIRLSRTGRRDPAGSFERAMIRSLGKS